MTGLRSSFARRGLLALALLACAALGDIKSDDARIPARPFDGTRAAEHPAQLINFQAITARDSPAFEITFSPTGPFKDGDFVTATIKTLNGASPSPNDWVALYSPFSPSMDTSTTAPLRYQFLNYDASYFTTGTAQLRWQLTNVRAAMGFVAFQNGLRKPVQAGSSANSIVFADVNEPLGGRVVPTGDPDSLKVLWSGGLVVGTPVVRFWPTNGGSNASAIIVAATPKQLAKNVLCGGAATSVGWLDLGYHFEAVLTGLSKVQGQKISWQYGDASRGVYSPVATLRVPNSPGDKSKPTRLIAFQDFGRGTIDDSFTWHEFTAPALNTTKFVLRDLTTSPSNANGDGYNGIFLTGDISYGMGYLNIWPQFLQMVQPVTRLVPSIMGLGNHESDFPWSPSFYNTTDSGGECSQAAAFMFPFANGATADTPWYSIETGLVHLITLSSEHDFAQGSPQWKWFEADLKSVNRSRTPWVIMGIHRPIYIDSTFGPNGLPFSDQDAAIAMRASLEPLMWQYRVNLAVYGHNHVFQRLSAAYQNELVQASVSQPFDAKYWAGVPPPGPGDVTTVNVQQKPQATVHMVVGSGGASFSNNSQAVPPEWVELVTNVYGYSRIHALNETTLVFEFVENSGGTVMDRLAIFQDPSAPWSPPNDDQPSGFSGGKIAAVVVGSVLGIVAIGAVLHFGLGIKVLPFLGGSKAAAVSEGYLPMGGATAATTTAGAAGVAASNYQA